ncbi:hypothetical protein [Micromonospora inyonensis]|uniref:Uncharacterized protein n=1 Tax=Micromonospora inyonensis TaxID=47866 RepID=A0A1C6S5T7_9ACTN|nr:hypothetical protein [Micromonospora inyonensis]SCL24821.1 hypothetical protein GA0074694_4048 [Micromonospora inyonensis]
MALQPTDDLSAAAWLYATDVDPTRLITFGPASFPAYARLRYLPDPGRPNMRESDVRLPSRRTTEIDMARTALEALADYSSSTRDCYVCVWEGGATFRNPALTGGHMVDLQHRRYVLFTGTLGDLMGWSDLFDSEVHSAPAFVWPADHAWCFASDVDPHWAGIGADCGVVDRLVADRNLDVVHADPEERQPTYY